MDRLLDYDLLVAADKKGELNEYLAGVLKKRAGASGLRYATDKEGRVFLPDRNGKRYAIRILSEGPHNEITIECTNTNGIDSAAGGVFVLGTRPE